MAATITAGQDKRAAKQAAGQPAQATPDDPGEFRLSALGAAAGVAFVVAFAWSYWPTLERLVWAWTTQPDYSHGFLVLPIAWFLLWTRAAAFPGVSPEISWVGLGLFAACLLIRGISAALFVPDLDGLSIPLCVAGAICLTCGRRTMWWAAPAIGFLVFMIPLPYQIERWFNGGLQTISTRLSTAGLQLLGQPAFNEEMIIYVGDIPLFVEEACAGLRIFMSVAALAYAFVAVVQRRWWEKLIVVLCAPLIAIISNATRIIVTALIMHTVGGESAEQVYRVVHDWAGLIMIPFSACLFGLLLAYLANVFRYTTTVDVSSLARRRVATG